VAAFLGVLSDTMDRVAGGKVDTTGVDDVKLADRKILTR